MSAVQTYNLELGLNILLISQKKKKKIIIQILKNDL